MERPRLGFWFEFASTYSYLTAMRIETVAADRGVDLDWRPFLLGPIFARQGWSTSPFNLYPAKGRYMWRDMERLCETLGLPLVMPDPFPQNGLMAARIAHAGRKDPWIGAFVRAVYMAEFGEGRDISDPALLAGLLTDLGVDAPVLLAAAEKPEVKIGLRAAVSEAETLGIFGAPSFVTADGELFWGNDRLEDALDWALRLTD
ncbi:2-hydroxychromene-2-carboxylate isomerase [Polymorphum gilvum]|uniref:2-hydroxychromene-2-carboxylate isomerase n=1 Tax=Polymorphum gilvum (strain LMG 25793 / CGMCC 1.9160 / SL003B-26A1) TaxID=991905 RepID=F2J0E0_POLGS|nr:2-hydroxychromene-2-carboxylate isomerase [Polymorphum gilvum]ADZ68674.1 2-hydroxychromene-2-carboxylate isomerase, putative [Polymorphum gilvum SL003B-26A1]